MFDLKRRPETSRPAPQDETCRIASRRGGSWRALRTIVLVTGTLTVLLPMGAASAAVPSTAGEATGQITGRVTSAATKTPIEDVRVCEVEYGRTFEFPTNCEKTNAKGEYALSKLTTGQYAVMFEPPASSSYVAQYYDGKPTPGEATPISATEGATTSGINGELHTGGQISGRVTSFATKTPIDGVQTCAYEYPVIGVAATRCTTTNANGEYVLPKLPTGEYIIIFEPPASSNYPTRYYDGTPKFELATPVSATEEATTPGINAELHTGGQITGRVTDAATKAPIEGVRVCEVEYGRTFQFPSNCARTNASGEYTLAKLATGQYAIMFEPAASSSYLTEYYDGETAPEPVTPVSATEEATTSGINAELHTGGQITGRVTAATTKTPLEGIKVCVDVPINCVQTNANGEYTLSKLKTGGYVISFEPPAASSYVMQYYDGTTTFTLATPVSTTEEATTPDINAELHTGGQITGRVTSAATKAPIEGSRVCEVEYGRAFEFQTNCANTDANGEYALSKLATGKYAIIFNAPWPSNYVTQYYDEKTTPEEAIPVSATEEATTPDINAELLGGPVAAGGPSAPNGVVASAGPDVSKGSPAAETLFSLSTPLVHRQDGVLLRFRCTASAQSCPAGRVLLTVVEHLKHGRVTAVTSTSMQGPNTHVVAIGSARLGALRSSGSETVHVRLTATVRWLTRHYRRLGVRVGIVSGGKTLASWGAFIA